MHVHAKPVLPPMPDLRPTAKPPAPARSGAAESLFALGQDRGGRGAPPRQERQRDDAEPDAALPAADPAAALASLLARIDLDAAS